MENIFISLKANEQKYYASFVKKKDVLQSCKEKAEQYQQIVDWLEELRDYKENQHRSLRHMYEKGYNEAINDFRDVILEKYTKEEEKKNYKFYACEIKQDMADMAEELRRKNNGKNYKKT